MVCLVVAAASAVAASVVMVALHRPWRVKEHRVVSPWSASCCWVSLGMR